jgi:hypothetical protein
LKVFSSFFVLDLWPMFLLSGLDASVVWACWSISPTATRHFVKNLNACPSRTCFAISFKSVHLSCKIARPNGLLNIIKRDLFGSFESFTLWKKGG